jgi:hypothetical protein
MFVQGNTAFFPTFGIFFIAGTVIDQFGDFLAVDISDPANPKLADVLFNNLGPSEGGNNNVSGSVVVNNQIAYLASTTSFSSNTQGGTGRVLVVNDADAAHLALVRGVDIPGTVQIEDIAIHGNRALVVGSTGGWRNPFGNIADAGLTGNLTLTVPDITDPQDPRIIGSTLVTENEFFQYGKEISKLDALDLENGLFAVSNTVRNGKPEILLVDPSDPTNILVGATEAASHVSGMTVSGNLLYATSTDGLAIYDIGHVFGTPVTVSVRVPKGTGVSIEPNSFNEAPTRIDSGTDYDTLVWDRTLGSDATDLTFTWRSTVSNLQPGDAREATLGTSVNFVSQGSPGTLSLPATVVASEQILGLAPASRTARPAEPAAYTLTVKNPTDAPVTYSLAVQGVPAGWVGLATSVTVGAKGSVDIPLTLASEPFAGLNDYGFTVLATAGTGARGSVQGDLVLAAMATSQDNSAVQDEAATKLAVAPSRGLTVRFDPDTQVLPVPGTASFLLQVDNTGNTEDAYTAVIMGSDGPVTASLEGLGGQPTQAIPLFRLPELATGAILLRANLQALGQGKVTVQVRSSDGSLAATATATVSSQAGPSESGPLATTTQIEAPPSAVAFGQPVTMTVSVFGPPGSAIPTGVIAFLVDGQARPPRPALRRQRAGAGDAHPDRPGGGRASGPSGLRGGCCRCLRPEYIRSHDRDRQPGHNRAPSGRRRAPIRVSPDAHHTGRGFQWAARPGDGSGRESLADHRPGRPSRGRRLGRVRPDREFGDPPPGPPAGPAPEVPADRHGPDRRGGTADRRGCPIRCLQDGYRLARPGVPRPHPAPLHSVPLEALS